MSILDEDTKTQLQSALAAGVITISEDQSVSFQEYIKYVMPTDRSVFWVKSNAPPLEFKGSLHFVGKRQQDVDQTLDITTVIFTALEEITNLNVINPQRSFIGQFKDPSGDLIRAAFGEHGPFYKQAGLWHYKGEAVYATLESQLVARPEDLPQGPIVSNSLPIWLALDKYAKTYTSFLVPSNLNPPYIAVNIDPEKTEALGAMPMTINKGDPTNPNLYQFETTQLMQDEVELILYGFNNTTAIQYLNYLIDYSLKTDQFGFCNSPSIRDSKEIQVELGVIAQKKTIRIKASYYMHTADAVMRGLILSASCALVLPKE